MAKRKTTKRTKAKKPLGVVRLEVGKAYRLVFVRGKEEVTVDGKFESGDVKMSKQCSWGSAGFEPTHDGEVTLKFDLRGDGPWMTYH